MLLASGTGNPCWSRTQPELVCWKAWWLLSNKSVISIYYTAVRPCGWRSIKTALQADVKKPEKAGWACTQYLSRQENIWLTVTVHRPWTKYFPIWPSNSVNKCIVITRDFFITLSFNHSLFCSVVQNSINVVYDAPFTTGVGFGNVSFYISIERPLETCLMF